MNEWLKYTKAIKNCQVYSVKRFKKINLPRTKKVLILEKTKIFGEKLCAKHI